MTSSRDASSLDTDSAIAIGDWLDACDPSGLALLTDRDAWLCERVRRQRGIDVILEVLGHVHSVSLGLLRLDNLAALDQVFVRFLDAWEIPLVTALTDEQPDRDDLRPRLGQAAALQLLREMRAPEHLIEFREWILRLSDPSEPENADLLKCPAGLPNGYAEWLPILIPHIEEEVWIGRSVTPLPPRLRADVADEYRLLRMMWLWKNVDHFQGSSGTSLSPDFTAPDQHFAFTPAFRRRNPVLDTEPLMLVAGPFKWEAAGTAANEHSPTVSLRTFLDRRLRTNAVRRESSDWTEQDLSFDRATPNVGMSNMAAIEVAAHIASSLRCIRAARIDSAVFQRSDDMHSSSLLRATWETVAVLGAWYAKWSEETRQHWSRASKRLTVGVAGNHMSLEIVPRDASDELTFTANADSLSLLAAPPSATGTPDAVFLRVRERQQLAWKMHLAAIQDLLAQSSLGDRAVGADAPLERDPHRTRFGDVNHLVRGIGHRVAAVLLDATLSDVATIYWCDYSSQAPFLRHVASAERRFQHWATRNEVCAAVDQRLCAIATQDPSAGGSTGRIGRGVALGRVAGSEAGRLWGGSKAAIEEWISLPLIYNDRVLGLVELGGTGSGMQFDGSQVSELRLAARILAQAMYHDVQIWQTRRINWLASHMPLESWHEQEPEDPRNPLVRVANCLANIFLCPGVQIWLTDSQNPRRLLLRGSTSLPFNDSQAAGRDGDTYFMRSAPLTDCESQPLSRDFLAFAVDLYADIPSNDRPAKSLHQPSRDELRLGRYVQARFIDNSEATGRYCLADAEQGKMQLHQDYFEAAPRHRWTQNMAFAMIGGEITRRDIVGVVSVFESHAGGSAPAASWPRGWSQIVAHVQTYLPYVLKQTEAIASPLYRLRRYLMHEGRNELNAVAIANANLSKVMARLFAVDRASGARPILRELLQRIRSNPDQPASLLTTDLEAVERTIEEVARQASPLASIEAAENIAILGRLIEHQRGLAGLDVDLSTAGRIHVVEWVPIKESLNAVFGAYSATLRERRVWWDLDTVGEASRLLTVPTLWRWIVGDLVHNVVKYASLDSGVQVRLLKRDGGDFALVLRNESSYDEELDHPDRLLSYGVQGSAGQNRLAAVQNVMRPNRGPGTGIGLWGVKQLASILGMSFEIRVVPQRQQGKGSYSFEFAIPRHTFRSR